MEETGAVINVGTSLFIVSLALCIAGCVALLLNAVMTGAPNSYSYQLATNFEYQLNANLATIIMAILLILHGLGYYCQYVKTPLSRCHLWLLVTGSLTVLVAAGAVLLVTRGNHIDSKELGYYNTAATAMQLLALLAFVVCMCKSGCFGKCNSNARLVFYVFVGIYAVWLLAYLAACAAYAVMYNKVSTLYRSGTVDAYEAIPQSYKRIPCVNYVLLIALTFSAYQVNFCCVPLTGTDWTFLLLFGTCAGILLSVAMHYQGGGSALHFPVPYVLGAFAAVIMAVLLMYSYFKEPFAQIVPGKKYTMWDLIFIVLAIVLGGITMALLIKWDEGSGSNEGWIYHSLMTAMLVCIAIELVMLHFGWVRGSSCDAVWQAVTVILVLEWIATLAMVIIEASGGSQIGMGFYAAYLLMMFHLLLIVATLLVCHYHMIFSGKYKLWHWNLSLWDTMLVLLVLESLVALVVALVRLYQSRDVDHGGYALFALHAIVCGIAVAIVHFKEPLSQYWARDRVACGIFCLVSLVTWLGVASFYGTIYVSAGDTLDTKIYCLVTYGLITFGGAVFYGFRSGIAQGSCFRKKNTDTHAQLQGSDEILSGTEVTVDGTGDTSDATEGTLTELPLPQDNTDVMESG